MKYLKDIDSSYTKLLKALRYLYSLCLFLKYLMAKMNNGKLMMTEKYKALNNQCKIQAKLQYY